MPSLMTPIAERMTPPPSPMGMPQEMFVPIEEMEDEVAEMIAMPTGQEPYPSPISNPSSPRWNEWIHTPSSPNMTELFLLDEDGTVPLPLITGIPSLIPGYETYSSMPGL